MISCYKVLEKLTNEIPMISWYTLMVSDTIDHMWYSVLYISIFSRSASEFYIYHTVLLDSMQGSILCGNKLLILLEYPSE